MAFPGFPDEVETQTTEETNSRRTLDPELRAINGILRILEEVPAEARTRVLLYVCQRFGGNATLKVSITEDDGE